MSKLLALSKATSAFKLLIKNALSSDQDKKIGHLDIAFVCAVLVSLLLAVGAYFVKRENDSVVSSPIIAGRILSVTYVNQARAFHRRAVIEFSKNGLAFDVCKIQADFNIASNEIIAGNKIRVFQPNPPCSVPIFPDYMTPTWELPIFFAISMLVALILFMCIRYRNEKQSIDAHFKN